jgi:hypothetical protein
LVEAGTKIKLNGNDEAHRELVEISKELGGGGGVELRRGRQKIPLFIPGPSFPSVSNSSFLAILEPLRPTHVGGYVNVEGRWLHGNKITTRASQSSQLN